MVTSIPNVPGSIQELSGEHLLLACILGGPATQSLVEKELDRRAYAGPPEKTKQKYRRTRPTAMRHPGNAA